MPEAPPLWRILRRNWSKTLSSPFLQLPLSHSDAVLPKLMMAPKRLISDENKESGESVNVSEPQPLTSGFTGEKL
ncbi:hypothetical protein E2C01_092139 [Portunus trituberculatus]|uniref:Uncharacterized protein n=1 Tax=Portunus trituberculatus TaxID=210409 RepID=A0A5B7JJC1_PORTR|nr:hypothetical protein [Portunus trituberculatus]